MNTPNDTNNPTGQHPLANFFAELFFHRLTCAREKSRADAHHVISSQLQCKLLVRTGEPLIEPGRIAFHLNGDAVGIKFPSCPFRKGRRLRCADKNTKSALNTLRSAHFCSAIATSKN